MLCPNCSDPGYEPKSTCAQCGWTPVSPAAAQAQRQIEQARRDDEIAKEATDNRYTLLASVVIGLAFLVLFWIFPSRRLGEDWFELSIWDGVSAAAIALIGYFATTFKK